MKKSVYNPTIHKNDIPKIFNKIKIDAITRKAIREGKDFNAIANILMTNSYFQEKEKKIGIKKVAELTRETIKKAVSKEKNSQIKEWFLENQTF